MKFNFKLLAIETSCDETAAAVIEFDKSGRITPLASVVASQIDLHKKYGGVFPELASRAHSQKILPVVAKALQQAGFSNWLSVIGDHRYKKLKTDNGKLITASSRHRLDAVAVTVGPGLIGSLIVGVEFARGLAAALNIPAVPVNHLEGHIFAGLASEMTNDKFLISNENSINNRKLITDNRQLTLPALALIVSGGHTLLVRIRKPLHYEIIGTTLDDAAGESFDKVARMLGLPYPGGPEISRLAEKGNSKAFAFPRAMLQSGDNNFSFSGLKTAVFYKLRELGLVDAKAEPIRISNKLQVASSKSMQTRADVAASFQAAVVDVLVTKTLKAAQKIGAQSIIVGGGVASNSALRAEFEKLQVASGKWQVFLSPKNLATDNALMIAVAGVHRFLAGDTIRWQGFEANASLRLK